jgi:hypothetical protein
MTDKRMETPKLSDDQIRDYWQRLQPMAEQITDLPKTITTDADGITIKADTSATHDAAVRVLVFAPDAFAKVEQAAARGEKNYRDWVAFNLSDQQARELMLVLADAIMQSRRG